MSSPKIPGLLVGAAWIAMNCAGCALTPEKTASGEEKHYRTGSHLPMTDRQSTEVKTVDPTTIRNDRPRSVGSPGVSGG